MDYEQNRKRLFPDVTDEQWGDWKWQVRNRVKHSKNWKLWQI